MMIGTPKVKIPDISPDWEFFLPFPNFFCIKAVKHFFKFTRPTYFLYTEKRNIILSLHLDEDFGKEVFNVNITKMVNNEIPEIIAYNTGPDEVDEYIEAFEIIIKKLKKAKKEMPKNESL